MPQCPGCSTPAPDTAHYCAACGRPLRGVEVRESYSALVARVIEMAERILHEGLIHWSKDFNARFPGSSVSLICINSLSNTPELAITAPARRLPYDEAFERREGLFANGCWTEIEIHVMKPELVSKAMQIAAEYQKIAQRKATVVRAC